MPTLRRINVVFVYVADIEKARDFYEKVLDLGQPLLKSPSWVEYHLGSGSHLALHQADPAMLEGTDRSRNTVKFSIVVDDLHQAHKELEGKGVKFNRPPEKGYGFDLAEFEDPEGNPIRLLQYTTMKVKECLDDQHQ